MKELVLWIDVAARLGLGALILFVPRLTIATLGLPKSADTFWPRLIGVLLLALAAGGAIDARWPGKGGPVLGGLVALNIATAFALVTSLAVGRLDIPKRGRLGLWLAAAACGLLGFVQMAWV